MNQTKIRFFKTGQTGIALNAVILLTLTGCVGYVDGPRAEVAVESPTVVVQDDYVYYPSYGVYYSGSRHEYAYQDRGAWVSRAGPPGVTVDVLLASPHVNMTFHDSPANHHAAVARQYPKNWEAGPLESEGSRAGRTRWQMREVNFSTCNNMLRSIKQMYGVKLAGLDGEFGHVMDFYFDDQHWGVRYVVADTGSWLTGRQVLISPYSLGRLVQTGKALRANLTRKQIEDSPSIDSHKPVSRQCEEDYHRHYGWPYYWQGDSLWGMSAVPIMTLLPYPPAPSPEAQPKRADGHLRSALAVTGYHLQASDGVFGHICDFMMDDESWGIGQLVIKTGHRFSGKEVQVPASAVDRISYEESTVFVNLTKEAVDQSPPHYAEALAEVV